jgi:hypothetical protein
MPLASIRVSLDPLSNDNVTSEVHEEKLLSPRTFTEAGMQIDGSEEQPANAWARI